ncbi:hypothetical protein PHMEG_00028902 [Phytophthora megakarya]|uniref:Retrotransposon gag domain-containing protein n=1 Tax=Phytophthora megakarya TaxID=4795 RepID=A0A225V3C1_9STRA|nr:hypothetical protein PHMEG_00028902 [Phytophthora megakarya]
MQLLRTFIYEMKGTHTPPNDWCMTFVLSLQDGPLHWYRQLSRKTRRTWKLWSDAFIKYYCSKFNQSVEARYYSAKREDKEHMYGYLNRLNGLQFENGGREVKDHVEYFLDTCDDRGREERLCHIRVKNIHDLEDMINDILKHRDRKTKCDSSMRRFSGQDGGRRRDSSRNEDSRSNYRRDSHYRDDRRRDELPYRPRITLAVLSVMENVEMAKIDTLTEAQSGHVAAANDYERRVAAEGTFARSDNRRSKGDGHFNNDRGLARDNRNGRQKFGPCHYCYKRCKLCKEVHDAGKCEAFNELASLLRSKVDTNDLAPMLQSVVYGNHLN